MCVCVCLEKKLKCIEIKNISIVAQMGLREKWGMIDPNKYRIYLGCNKMRFGIFPTLY